MASDAEPAGTEPQTATAAATQFLLAALANGPRPAAEVARMAQERAVPPKPLRMAKEGLRITATRRGFGPKSWVLWALPKGQTDAPAQLQERDAPAGLTPDEARIPAEEGSRCDYCDRDGAVYVHNPFDNNIIETLHEKCAGHWHQWLGNIREDARDRFLSHARDRMLNRARGKGGRGPV